MIGARRSGGAADVRSERPAPPARASDRQSGTPAAPAQLPGPAGNFFDKYNTKNFFYRFLVRRFLAQVRRLAHGMGAAQVLEMGCGEGHLARALLDGWDGATLVACDVALEIVQEARQLGGRPVFHAADACRLPFRDGSFDVVVMCEVMEHLVRPDLALGEACRVARRACLLSVPREPVWRLLNVLRGAYWSEFGNTPGHVQWWSKSAFLDFVRQRGSLLATASPFPWTIALIEPHGA
jgi:SAM-dependent methyltransferase